MTRSFRDSSPHIIIWISKGDQTDELCNMYRGENIYICIIYICIIYREREEERERNCRRA